MWNIVIKFDIRLCESLDEDKFSLFRVPRLEQKSLTLIFGLKRQHKLFGCEIIDCC
jgi:hypothetical protein